MCMFSFMLRASGEDPGAFWGRSVFGADIFPGKTATYTPVAPFLWGRSSASNQTFPKTGLDLPHIIDPEEGNTLPGNSTALRSVPAPPTASWTFPAGASSAVNIQQSACPSPYPCAGVHMSPGVYPFLQLKCIGLPNGPNNGTLGWKNAEKPTQRYRRRDVRQGEVAFGEGNGEQAFT